MNKLFTKISITSWNIVLLVLVVITIFIIGIFPQSWHSELYNSFYTMIYLVSILAIKNKPQKFIGLAAFMIVLQWSTEFLDLDTLATVTNLLSFIFFGYAATKLIMQVATAEKVGGRVILEAINGYLLMGLVYSIIVAMVIKLDPGAINFPVALNQTAEDSIRFSDSLYYTFISITTMGYGDFVPTQAYTKSLATLIGVSGQLYVAIIIALLVGKFSNQKDNN